MSLLQPMFVIEFWSQLHKRTKTNSLLPPDQSKFFFFSVSTHTCVLLIYSVALSIPTKQDGMQI